MLSGGLAESILFVISKFLLKRKGAWKSHNTSLSAGPIILAKKDFLEEQLTKDLKRLFLRFSSFNNKVILDLGCGDGKKTKYFAEMTQKTIGIDRNPILIKKAQMEQPFNCEFKVGKAENIPLADNSIDMVICIEAWEHMVHTQKVLDEIYRVLKTGSFVFIYFAPWFYPTGSHVESFIPLPWCHVFFSEKTICKVITRIQRCNDFIHPPYTLTADGKTKLLFNDNNLTGDWLTKITEREFRVFLEKNRNRFSCIHYELMGFGGHTSKIARFFRPFRYFPILREYIGGFIICVLKKLD